MLSAVNVAIGTFVNWNWNPAGMAATLVRMNGIGEAATISTMAVELGIPFTNRVSRALPAGSKVSGAATKVADQFVLLDSTGRKNH